MINSHEEKRVARATLFVVTTVVRITLKYIQILQATQVSDTSLVAVAGTPQATRLWKRDCDMGPVYISLV